MVFVVAVLEAVAVVRVVLLFCCLFLAHYYDQHDQVGTTPCLTALTPVHIFIDQKVFFIEATLVFCFVLYVLYISRRFVFYFTVVVKVFT